MKRIVCALVCLAFLAGCGSTSATQAPTTRPATAGNVDAKDFVSDTPIKLTYWAAINGKGYDGKTDFNDTWVFREYQKMTNVEIEWLHPPVGQETEQFNLIIASADYPDIALHSWLSAYPGGPEKAVADNVIIKLNEYMTRDVSPNLLALYDEHPDFKKNAITDEGTHYYYPFVRGYCLYDYSKWATMFTGPQYRMDWAAELGIDPPDTLDEWYDMLVIFRDSDVNGTGEPIIPLVSPAKDLNNWAAPFGTLAGWRMDGEKVVYGPLDKEFVEYLTVMSKWFSEGLIDPDYLITDGNMFMTKVVSNVGGAYIGGIGGNFGGITQAFEQEYGDKDVLGALPWPKNGAGKRFTTEGTRVNMGMGSGAAIFTSNKYPKETAKFLDLAYRWDMIDMLNFGIPGETFVREGNEIKITDKFRQEMLAAKDMNTVVTDYCIAAINGYATFMHPSYYELQYTIRNQTKAAGIWNLWNDGLTDELVVPPITLTVDEASEVTSIMQQIDTYFAESRNKVIMGELPVSYWEETFVKEVNRMNIDKAAEVRTDAYNRYKLR